MRATFLFVSVLCSGASLSALGCGRTGLAGDVLADGDPAAIGGTHTGGKGSGGTHSGGTSSGGSHSENTGGMPSTGGTPSEARLELFPETLPEAHVTRQYSALFTAEGGVGAPYRFLVVQGELPPGLALATDGKLAGTPTKEGEYSFRVRVTDLGGNDAERDYVLVVSRSRYLAYTTFMSSSSTRSAVKVVDVTKSPLAPVTLLDDNAGGIAFSSDGRWLSFHNYEDPNNPVPVAYLVNTAGDSPGPLVPLLDEGQLDNWWSYVWSPDATALAYIKVNGDRLDLWTVEVLAEGLGERRLRVEDVAPGGLSWPRADTLVYSDTQERQNFLRIDASGSTSNTLVNVPEVYVRSMAPNEELAFGGSPVTGYFLIDSATGAMQLLDGYNEWWVRPSFDFLVGRTWPGSFGILAVNGTEPELLVLSSNSAVGVYPANAAPRFVHAENGRLVVSTLDGSGVASVQEIEGDYGSPSFGMYTPSDQQFVFHDATALWASPHTGDAPAKARKLTDFAGPGIPGMSISPDSRWLLTTTGAPQVARLVPLEESSTDPIRDLSQGLNWGYHYWSADSQTIVTTGASAQLGRVLEVRRLDDPSTPLMVASCETVVTTTACPNSVELQP